jgi:hypothetical protein
MLHSNSHYAAGLRMVHVVRAGTTRTSTADRAEPGQVCKEFAMVIALLREQSPLLRMTVDLPDADGAQVNKMDILVRMPAERAVAVDTSGDGDGDGEPTWEDAAWQ